MLNLIRTTKENKSIYGTLYHNDKIVCKTLENVDKVIPEGIYAISVCKSPAFTKKRGTDTYLPLIYNKSNPATRGLRIHVGTKPEHSEGCILVPTREIETFVTLLCKYEKETMIAVHDNFQ